LGLHPFGHFTFDDICDFREYYKAAIDLYLKLTIDLRGKLTTCMAGL